MGQSAIAVAAFFTLLTPVFLSAQTSCPNLTRNLSLGSRGQDVVQLQNFLISQSFFAAGNNTAYFGRLTRSAVQKWQCKNMNICSGSPASNGWGSVGPRTRAAIANSCKIQIVPPAPPHNPTSPTPSPSPTPPSSTSAWTESPREWGPYGADSLYVLAGYSGLGTDGTYSDSVRTGARQALRAAKDKGISSIRFAIGGPYFEHLHAYALMQLWREKPESYFQALDLLAKDASDLHMRLIPVLFFGIADIPEMNSMQKLCGLAAPPLPYGKYATYAQYVESAANTLPFISGSNNNKLMTDLALQVVDRYKSSPTIAFWELGNEINNYAKERSLFASINGTDYYTQCLSRTDIKNSFASLAHMVKSHDPSHKISAGLIQESGNEWPLTDIPGDMDDIGDVFRFFNTIPDTDIASVHLYSNMFDPSLAGQGTFYYSFKGGPPVSVSDVVQYFNRQADQIGKELWIGEYGVIDEAQAAGQCDISQNGWANTAQLGFISNLHITAQAIGVSYLSAFSWGLDIF